MESNFIQKHSFEYQINQSNSLLVKKYLSRVNLNPQKIFIYDSNTSYTGQMIKKKIQYYIFKLKKGKQDIVILKSRNSANWVFIYLATKILNKLAFIVSDSVDKNTYELIQNNFQIHSKFENNKLKFIKNKKKKSFSKINLKTKKIMDCIFTTGTTGKPKGVLVSEKAYLHTVNILISKSQQNTNDIELLSMPFSHSFGIARLRASLLNGQSCPL